jgi:uncharacterized protein with HEPN domain
MIAAVSLIETWTQRAGGVEIAIFSDALVRSAIERQLLIISEAAIRLHRLEPELTSAVAPEIDWPGVRGIGKFPASSV